MSPRIEYRRRLTDRAHALVDYTTERGTLVTYRVVLVAWSAGAWHTVRVYDNAHGRHDMHRHTIRGGKERAETFHHGTPSEAMNGAIDAIRMGYEEMVAAWLR